MSHSIPGALGVMLQRRIASIPLLIVPRLSMYGSSQTRAGVTLLFPDFFNFWDHIVRNFSEEEIEQAAMICRVL
ncbi:hypothetical protein M5689_020166 [Euphorbia peplus]|nr:hypothetical protein M5689_020166 [Euphorbia peplus]